MHTFLVGVMAFGLLGGTGGLYVSSYQREKPLEITSGLAFDLKKLSEGSTVIVKVPYVPAADKPYIISTIDEEENCIYLRGLKNEEYVKLKSGEATTCVDKSVLFNARFKQIENYVNNNYRGKLFKVCNDTYTLIDCQVTTPNSPVQEGKLVYQKKSYFYQNNATFYAKKNQDIINIGETFNKQWYLGRILGVSFMVCFAAGVLYKKLTKDF